MKSAAIHALPLKVRRSLLQLGKDLSVARRRRHLTISMMCERTTVSKSTYLSVESGSPTVSLGVYAMAMFALGLGTPLDSIIDTRRDETGLLLDEARLPKRVRPRKSGMTL